MPAAGVVLHPDIDGLRPLFDDMARRLATPRVRGRARSSRSPDVGSRARRGRDRYAHGAGRTSSTTRATRRSLEPRPICSWSKTTSRASRCSASAWAVYYTFKAAATDRFDRAVAFYGMLRDARRWQGRGTPRAARYCGRGVPDARDLRLGRHDDAARRHRRRCGPRGTAVTIARSSSSKVPTTASSTTPNAPCTAPTTPPAMLDQSPRLGAELDLNPGSRCRARRGRGCGTGCVRRPRASRADEHRDRLVDASRDAPTMPPAPPG